MGFTIPVPFGRGLDRASGASSADSSDFSDLRNVALGEGRAGLRTGMVRAQTLSLLPSGAGITDILDIARMRSLGVGAAIAYNSTTRVVSLWLLSGDGTSALYVGDLYTISASAPFPRIISDDSYGKLFIAHDEPTYAYRQNTKVYDPALALIADVPANLNTATVGSQPVKFRGVVRWLNYLVGWGYGTEDDGDRPEVVRISSAADPMTWLPNYYWIAGQRGDGVLRCSPCAGGLLALKATEAYLIFGSAQANFGIRPVDEKFGILGSKLAVTVGGVSYRWAADGPRRSDGGASDDLAMPLDIGGPLPDILADPTSGDYAFAAYMPVEREVLFVFGTWAYVLHLKNPSGLRWSYRQYAVEPSCIAPLLDTGGSIFGPTIFPTCNGTVGTPGGLDVTYTASGAVAGERVEIWTQYSGGGAWTMSYEGPAVATETRSITGLVPLHLYYVGIRFKKGGLAAAAYASSNASTWPAVSQCSGTPLTIPLGP